ncbi:conserved protein of unknown function [Kyrpidia spormannii]|uniref:Uncharacterized protein n=3 Tax=Alicyclobacillaceae TaxID=186823 RepID=A0ACA8Z601_9BACL|nr:conserved protein of unknown function [Kyrpidia spormannii]CAB3391247.1 conserved protein of unknown function [Kyrpidia spormannii]
MMAKRTKDLIYQGAVEVFSKRGFGDTTMDAIAEQCGVAKGTLYYNFKTKEELFTYVMRRGLSQLTDRLRQALLSTEDPVHKWVRAVESQFRFFEENRAFCHLLVQKIWSADVQGQLSVQEVLSEYFQLLDDQWAAAKARHWIDDRADVQTLSGAFFGMVVIPAARAVLHGGAIDAPERVRTIVKMILRQMKGVSDDELASLGD